MQRQATIEKLQSMAPVVTQVTATMDMGYEFSAVVPNGVIYAEPGMLLDYSGGEWPPQLWEEEATDKQEELLKEMLLSDTWAVTPWNDLSDDALEQWLNELSGSDA